MGRAERVSLHIPHRGGEARRPDCREQDGQRSGGVTEAVEEQGRGGGAKEPGGSGEEDSRRGRMVQWLQLWALQPGCPGSYPSSAV